MQIIHTRYGSVDSWARGSGISDGHTGTGTGARGTAADERADRWQLAPGADILAAQQADPFRVDACRRAAHTLLGDMEDLAAIFERGGRQALEAIPGIGISIAGAIAEMLTSGLFLEHLKGPVEPEKLF